MSKTISSNLSLVSFRLFFSKPFVGYLVLPLPSYEATLLLDLLLTIIYFQGVVGSIVMGFLSYSSMIFSACGRRFDILCYYQPPFLSALSSKLSFFLPFALGKGASSIGQIGQFIPSIFVSQGAITQRLQCYIFYTIMFLYKKKKDKAFTLAENLQEKHTDAEATYLCYPLVNM